MKRLFTTFMVGVAGMQVLTPEAAARPKLVVGIIVDQLRTDYLETLQDKFEPGGFRLLMDKGAYIKDLDFRIPDLDGANATAIIQTGTYPRQNGISGASVYSPSHKRIISVLNDPAYIGNFTSETYSPDAIRVTTLTDEIAMAANGSSTIHSISPNAEEAIILAGHAGNSAFWINDETGNWASTTYYKSLPSVLQNRNYNSALANRLDTMKWTPLKSVGFYPDVTFSQLKDGFKYTFSRSDRDVYDSYKHSPYVNSDITTAAAEYLSNLKLGRNDETTDVLNLVYTAAPYPEPKKGDGLYELEDTYLRLDRDLSRLFRELDKSVGLDNVLVYVASTGYFEEPERDMAKLRLPTGTFSVKRAMSLLNAYLAAKYGNGSYIDQYANGQLYLDKAGIELKNLEIKQVAEDTRDFLVRMSGVADAFTVTDLQSPAVAKLEGHRLANDPKNSGDVIIEFNPGWQVSDDTRFPAQSLPEKSTGYASPAFIMGFGIAPQIIEYPVDATAIAPTIAKNLRIRSPNGAVSKALNLK